MVTINILGFNRDLRRQIGKRYKLGAEVMVNAESIEHAKFWDCSEFFQVFFNKYDSDLPDGSLNQYNFTVPVKEVAVGDLGFSSNPDSENPDNPLGINHVFYLIDNYRVIEARGKPYNSVILRPKIKWEKWRGFRGWRMVPDVKFKWPDGRYVRNYDTFSAQDNKGSKNTG